MPALVLAIVAFRQIHLVRTEDLSPWKGGGFGMFASTDSATQRKVRLIVEAPDRSEEVPLTRELRSLAQRAATLPSEGWLRELAEATARAESLAGRPVSRVRVEVWRTTYAPGDLESEQSLVRGFDHDVEIPRD